MALFLPTYFSPISQYNAIVKSDEIVFEVEDNYQKQTYRNRCYIFGANGKQTLNIPVKHQKTTEKKKTKNALVENDSKWQSHHLKSLQSAYRTSPFFEFYIDDLMPIFKKKYRFLLDVNIDTYLILSEALELESYYSKTTEYGKDSSKNDFRFLSEIKQKPQTEPQKYIQMFDDKHGFLPNLSILDLIFMEGPNAINFL
jgi:hypothetical protein